MMAELLAPFVRAALEVSVLLVVVYGITTSTIGVWLRMMLIPSLNLFTLIACPLCTGWWVAVLVAQWNGDVLLTPLYFMAIPITQRLLPDFLTGPSKTELNWFQEHHEAKAAKDSR